MTHGRWNEANIEAFLSLIDPEDDATGGGTASATAGAMAAGLVGMVARLSIGKEGMEEEAYYREVDREVQGLTSALFDGAREDAEAFGAVLGAFRLPKGTDDEKSTRSAAIQDAMIGATRVPLENAERCARVHELGRMLEGRSNENAASDLECALGLAVAGARGCLSNVDINLTSIKDEAVRSNLGSRSDAIKDALESIGADQPVHQRQA